MVLKVQEEGAPPAAMPSTRVLPLGNRTRGMLGSQWPRIHLTGPSIPQISPEEEERRRVRRERNKLAAAKCRNRRKELTDFLQAVSTGRCGGCLGGPRVHRRGSPSREGRVESTRTNSRPKLKLPRTIS